MQGARTGNGEVRISWGAGTPTGSGGQVTPFALTGGPQLFEVPAGVTAVDVRAVGAQGGTGTALAGLGADVSAEVAVTPGQVLAVLVGGRGGNGDGCGALSCGEPVAGKSIGGFNGGGSSTFAGAGTGRGTGGGGATDLRRGSWRLDKRIVVAGGGGGSAVSGVVEAGRGRGGDASGPIGDDGAPGDGRYVGGGGGTQSAGGAGGGAYAGAGRALDGGSGGGGWFGGGGGGGDSSGGSPGGGGAGSSHVTDPIGEPAYASNTAGGDGQLTITAEAAEPGSTPAPTAPGSVVLTPVTSGELRVGSIWKVTGTFSKPLRSYAWLRCTSLDPTTCTRMAGATAATYRTRTADLSRFVAVDVADTDGNTGRSEPRFIQENVCKVPIEFNDGAYYKTRTRASTTITPRPGWGCMRINMFIAAEIIDLLGYGNDRGPSPLADATASKGSIWVNFETGRLDVVANHTDTKVASFNAFPVNVTKNADSGVADALVRCIRSEKLQVPHLDKFCQGRVYETFRKANSAGFYFPSTNTSGPFRIRYHFTNAARRYTDMAPAAIDGIFGFTGTADGRISVSCAFIDKFPSIEIYQDWPSPKAGGVYTLRKVFYRKESSPRDLNASAPKFSTGKCGRIARPTNRKASMERLPGVMASVMNQYYAPIGTDPYEDVMRDYKTWSPM
ncbi:glycine-rich protein [Actinoplanes sp. CA-015351]|uniref:glycine-rich protein n=1 Tax=Actinoplanes sp. CA-015351 TaxID=3239897 RepID=UPI003D956085